MKQYYLSTLNLDAALAKADEIKANRERLAALEKAQAAQKEQALSEREQINSGAGGEEVPHADGFWCPPSLSFSDSAQTETPQEKEEKLQVTFMVIGTADQLVALQTYMENAQLRYTFQ